MRARPSIRLGPLVVLAAAALACGTRFPVSELPAAPIAFVRQEASEGVASFDEFMAAVQFDARTRREMLEGKRDRRRARTTVMLLDPSTGEMERVRDAGVGALPLDWSQDGHLLLIGRVDDRRFGIQLFSWNRLTGAYDRQDPDRSDGPAALGPGPIRLALTGRVVAGGGSSPGLFVKTDARGTEPLRQGLGGIEPDVSPDGRSVLFVRPTGRTGKAGIILRWDLGEKEPQPIARGRNPRYSRDGHWVTYVSTRAGNPDIWLMRPDGSAKRAVAVSGFDEIYPALSPDARYVVYASARGHEKESQLFVKRVADGVEIQLTQNGQNGRPVW